MSITFKIRFNPAASRAAFGALLIAGLLGSASTLAAITSQTSDSRAESAAWGSSGVEALGSRRLLGNSVDVPLGKNTHPEVAVNLTHLRRKAAASDKIRVIVGVRAAFAPEGFQDRSTRQRQRQEIGAVQSAIEKALPRRDAARIQRLTAVPFMAMEVDADQLEALAAMPEVTDIQEDRQAWTSLAQSIPLIQADDAWSAGYVGKDWAVAVLDNGVQTSHPCRCSPGMPTTRIHLPTSATSTAVCSGSSIVMMTASRSRR